MVSTKLILWRTPEDSIGVSEAFGLFPSYKINSGAKAEQLGFPEEDTLSTRILKSASLFQLLSTSTTAYADGASISRGATKV